MKPIHISAIQCLLIDLDDTLYPANNGLWHVYKERINRYLIEEMGFPSAEVPDLRHRLYVQYGTTLRGLQHEFEVDMDHFLTYVHDAPLEGYLQPDSELLAMLEALPQRKVIFTNAHTDHARRVLAALGVSQAFETIVDIYRMAPYCKPQPEAYRIALSILGEKPEGCLMVDDSPKNLKTARQLGMHTVSIGPQRHRGSHHIASITDLMSVFSADSFPKG
jgi:putative hydrolase of the HAD superfamily